jgi:four helix bundle protein
VEPSGLTPGARRSHVLWCVGLFVLGFRWLKWLICNVMKFHYENLIIIKDIHEFIKEIYRITKSFPHEERYGITSQIRRSATSVLLNLAEGSARRSAKEYARFIKISIGSLVENDAALKISLNLGYVSMTELNNLETLQKSIYFTLIALRKKIEGENGLPRKITTSQKPL